MSLSLMVTKAGRSQNPGQLSSNLAGHMAVLRELQKPAWLGGSAG